jgi:DeoR family transcriptional regulator of aga operon
MFPEERRNTIVDILKKYGRRGVADLARDLDVSEVTIRQDLDTLQSTEVLRRSHGGAILNSKMGYEESFQVADVAFRAEKERIGKAAADLIADGETVIMDSGTTIIEAAKNLKIDKKITVITSALNIALVLEEYRNVTVIVTGGTLRPGFHMLVNPYGHFILDKIQADVAFIGVSGIVAEHGITNANVAEAEIKTLFIKSARKRIVLADSSKIGNVAMAKIAGLSDIDLLITDSQADPVELTLLREKGLTIQVV